MKFLEKISVSEKLSLKTVSPSGALNDFSIYSLYGT